VSWPKARFGLDWPAGVADAGNSIYVFTGSGNYYMGLFRSLYGTALEEVVRASDGYNFIANLGVSTGQYQYGGASLQTALFDYNENLPTAPYEEDNPIESHGFRDDGLTPVVLAPNPPSMAAPQARKLLITGRYGKWFSSVYRGNRAAATAAGATHNEFSDVMGQKTYEWENIGCNNSPFTMANVNVCNLALRRDNPKQMRGIDILTGYHRKSTMGQVWSYDPRAAASARMYPNQSDNLVIDAIALTNKVLASGLAAGQTITAPDGTVITLTVGMKVLLQNQTTVAENGVVTITAGVPTYLGSPPTQVSSPKWGQYTNTAVSTWVRTYNYTSLPIIFTDTTTHAFGIWSPQIPLTGEGSNTSDGAGIGQYNIQDYGSAKDMNGWEAQIHGVQNGARYLMDRNILRFKAVFAVGTYAEVKTALQGTWNQWGKVLRPSYFDYTYLQANVRGLETWTEDQIRLWWLCRGANQGVIAKSGATITGGLSPTANYNFWRDAP
jgi:hypothetical protein